MLTRQGIKKISNMLTRQGIKKISNMKTFAISFLCSPSKRRKNGENPIEVSFSHSHQTQGTKKTIRLWD